MGIGALVLVLFVVGLAVRVVRHFNAPSDESKIQRTIEVAATSTDPSYCERLRTKRYLEQVSGEEEPFADDICESQASEGGARSVAVRAVDIHDERATALATHSGGSLDGSTVRLGFAKEDGHWKLDKLISFLHFDRERFRRAYGRSFLEFGSPTRAAHCAIGRERRLSDGAIERALLIGASETFVAITVACDREGVERSLVEGVAEPEFELPLRMIGCAERRFRAATDAELVRMELDIQAYAEVLLECDPGALNAYQRRELSDRYGLDSAGFHCVLETFHRLGPKGTVRLTYDEDRYEALIESCD
jgi:hypothetical protein